MRLRPLIKDIVNDVEAYPNVKINDISTDSCSIKKGSLFFAIKGSHHDGHDYINDAIKNNVSAIIANKELKNLSVPLIKVKDTRRVLSKIASKFYKNPSKKLKIIGVTGTNGKTTTSSLIKSIFDSADIDAAQLGTNGLISKCNFYNSSLTTPDPIYLNKLISMLVEKKVSYLIMEVSSHSIDQHRVTDIEFDTAIFTNLSQDHLDYHKTIDNYFNTKLKLFKMIKDNRKCVINYDNQYGKIIDKKIKKETIKSSINLKVDFHYKSLKCDLNGIKGIISHRNENIPISSEMIGEFNAENILLAVSACKIIGLDTESIVEGINNCVTPAGRMEIFKKNNIKIIIDYAHTPDAYEKVLSSIKNLNKGKINILFGCGGNRDKTKRAAMGSIADKYSDYLWITPDNPRLEDIEKINNQIIFGIKSNHFKSYNDREKGLKDALNTLKNDDILVVLGKGRENYQLIENKKIFHSDYEIIMEYINEN
ncbi:MAG: UDP-N-acetylmuramoyl-L-alanyl-D-glutamate--2,6-diaminopimelate ligase [bacterium TMED144]|nr:MAG: UDP-N-acetylmuramoyl-L-alanyl-D-glutamate--2,6-diaminopimelate ligase [bacterium TMED144]|tara:strand:- start:4526 stop:5965 length:1440 start_codon:yes stop_codon:yes gene_type:complete